VNRKPNAKAKRMAAIIAAREQAERDLAAKAVDIAHQIGTEADAKLLKILKGNGLLPMPEKNKQGKVVEGELAIQASPQLVAAIRLGLQRSGRLIERVESTDIKRPLRDASESELIAELEGRSGDEG